MRFQYVTLALLGALITACNSDDISKNRSEPFGQPQITETVVVTSGIQRERGSKPITYTREIEINSEGLQIRNIPDVRLDDDGLDGKNASTRTSKGRPTTPCGLTAKTTLKDKTADCALESKNGEKALWNGTTEAGSAEGSWALVTLAEDTSDDGKYEVWLDQRTGMVWSDIISSSANWCEASGNQQATSDDIGINCAETGKGLSLCTNLNLSELPKVNWRLPTRADYLQADLDGIRFVLSRSESTFWTATTSSDVTKRDKAWSYHMTFGTLIAELMDTSRSVRCIGTPNF